MEVGIELGLLDGLSVDRGVGNLLIPSNGNDDGQKEGKLVGWKDDFKVGLDVGSLLGLEVGTKV